MKSIEKILEKAKIMYPIGTKFKNLYRHDLYYIVTDDLYIQSGGITHIGIYWVYKDGKWAEIVKLGEIKEKYYEIY